VTYGTTTRMALPFADAVDRVRAALAEQGFGILTEIDVRATMKNKLDTDMEDYVILGACNPPLAHQALEADRSLGLLLPCNVVVRSAGDNASIVEMLDPGVMSTLSDAAGIDDVAVDAARRLQAARETLVGPPE
jgi:uncharacterized protein (DUF302 family)